MNLLRANKNESVDKAPANSIWTARVVRHVNITLKRLVRALVNLVSLFFWQGIVQSNPLQCC